MVEIIKKSDKTAKIDLVMANRWESEQWLQSSGYYEEWRTWHDLYRNIPKSKKYAWQSNIFIPMTMSKVETAISNLQGVLFSLNPPFEVKPREGNDAVQADLIKKLIAYQFDVSGTILTFTDFLRNLCIYGTAISKVIWDVKIEDRVEWMDVYEPYIDIFGMQIGNKFVGQRPQEKKKQVYACPKMINCNIADIFPDPSAIEIQDGWIIHRTRRSLDYLLQMHKNFPEVYNSEVLKLTDEDATEQQDAKEEIESNMGRLTKPSVSRTKGEGAIELLERWGLYPVKDETGTRLVPYLMTVANGKYLIRDGKNPYWHGQNPFIKATYVNNPNEFYGIGIPEILEDLQNNLNEIINQRNDNISFAMNLPAIAPRGSGLNQKNYVMMPGKLFTPEDSVDSLKFLEIQNVTRDSFGHTQSIEKWAQEVTSVVPAGMGVHSAGQTDTASGIALLQRASGERFITIARNIEAKAFKELVRFFYQLDYQFVEQDEMISVAGEKGQQWIKVSPDIIRRDYDFVPAGVFTMENKQGKSLRMIQFYNIIKGNPLFKESEYLKKLYSILELGDDPFELIREDAEMQEIQNLATQIAQQDLAAVMGVPPDKGDGAKQSPGMSQNSGQFQGDTQVGTPGMPPVGTPVPPTERI